MAQLCNALVSKFDTDHRGTRIAYTGPCVFELGHDGDHAPDSWLRRGTMVIRTDALDELQETAERLRTASLESGLEDQVDEVLRGINRLKEG